MENDSMDLGLENIWHSWFAFRKCKRPTPELEEFQFGLEGNLSALHRDLNSGTYRHGGYRKFIAHDNKRREISVARIRDRVVHRLVYDYLVPIFDKTFVFDAWSCRVGKGLLGAIKRAQGFLWKNPNSYVWKGDVRKFFDSVDQGVLLGSIFRRVQCPKARWLIQEVVGSFPQREREPLPVCLGDELAYPSAT
jgi:RNA-directed DNA polymerase